MYPTRPSPSTCFRFDEGSHAAIRLLEQGAGRVTQSARKRPAGVSATDGLRRTSSTPKSMFQRGDVFGHSRLAQVQPLRCTDERALLGKGEERPQTGLKQHESKL